ncbi:MAG: type VI secretion system-associated FHA domain protein TagH [Nitrospirae bacterium]|nr:type VI secretion system-associated FHA domain protein TagH [Nitrospirota bacterium]
MPCRLVVRPLSDTSVTEPFERSYCKDVIQIGRQDSSDVQLRDTRRLISGRHAEIRNKDRKFILVDVGSKNGTHLNGQRLIVGKEYLLDQEDRITIGDFIIQCYPLDPTEGQPPAAEIRADSMTTSIPNVKQEALELIETLHRTYWEHIEADSKERKSLLMEAIRKALRDLDEVGAKRMLNLVESRFPEPEYQQQKILQGSSNQSMECSTNEYELWKTAFQGVLKIAGRYFHELDTLKSPQAISELIERLDRILAMMLGCLANSIKGRKQFEQEFDVEATRIFSWKPNPIKLAEGDREIGEYLLNWRKGKPLDKVVSDLEDAFTDLALHQMGLMAGFKEGLRGLLKEMDPGSLEAEAQASPFTLGPFKIPCRFRPLLSWAAWNRFKERYRELSEKEVKTFETIWGPFFAKGYMSVQKRKKAS